MARTNGVLHKKIIIIQVAVLTAHIVHGIVSPNEKIIGHHDYHSGSYAVNHFRGIGEENCSVPAIEQFPRPVFSAKERVQGWLAFHVILSIYMCVTLSDLCEAYFIPAIEVLTETLQIDPDVSGATFLAGASSVPAIASSLIAILVAEGDLGVSTALGSAVLNTAGCVSVGALFAGKIVMLSRWPLYRDTVFCFVSMLVMVYALYDSIIYWYEALALLLFYFLYIVFMVFDKPIKAYFLEKFNFLRDEKLECDFPTEDSQRKSIDVPPALVISFSNVSNAESAAKSSPKQSSNDRLSVKCSHQIKAKTLCEEKHSFFAKLFLPPSNRWHIVFWILYLPFKIVFSLTIPSCNPKGQRKYFIVTLLMSTLYITVFSYILVWMIAIIGYTLGIPDAVMGLTFLAIAVTLPDIVISILIVRKGSADMAISNAMGSNVVEILVGLALPWLVKTTIITPGIPVFIESRGMMYFTIYLLLSLVFLIVCTSICKWRMTKSYGIILLLWYIKFLILSVLHELGYLNGERIITCASDY